MRKVSWNILFILLLIAGSVAVRLSNHLPNATPVAAIALLAGATLRAPWAMAVPLTAMAVADFFIGFYSWPMMLAVYGSFALTVLLGRWLKRRRSAWKIIGASLAASTLFYLITNAAVWRFGGLYPHTIDGLRLSYYYAIPFFRNTLLGDAAYVGSLFLAVKYVPLLARKIRIWVLSTARRSRVCGKIGVSS